MAAIQCVLPSLFLYYYHCFSIILTITRSPVPPLDKETQLSKYLPDQVKEHIYGETSNRYTNATAIAHRSTLRIPTIYVYVISTNKEHLNALAQIFRGLPSLIFHLSAKDFLDTNLLTYAGMGVDRVANLAAARFLYPQAPSWLVVDGGTALTYTTVVAANTDSEDAAGDSQRSNKQQLGGGIGPGLRLKFRSLHDYTGELPFIEYKEVQNALQTCMETQTALPLFASAGDKAAIEPSLMGCVMQETALLLCNVIRGFLSTITTTTTAAAAAAASASTTATDTTTSGSNSNEPGQQQLPVVLVTGGDADIYERLLRPNHSYICEPTAENQRLLEAALVPLDQEDASIVVPNAPEDSTNNRSKLFLLQTVKHLYPHAVRAVLQSNKEKAATAAAAKQPSVVDDERVRSQLLGQRVAFKVAKKAMCGTITAVIRKESLDEDYYTVFYDEQGLIDDLDIAIIYGQ